MTAPVGGPGPVRPIAQGHLPAALMRALSQSVWWGFLDTLSNAHALLAIAAFNLIVLLVFEGFARRLIARPVRWMHRLAALGGAPDQPDAALVWQRSQPSAAQAWLGEQHLPLAQRLDEQQADDNARHCQRARDEREALVAEQHDLQRKRRIRALSGHEIARLAWLYRTLGEAGDEALRLLEDALQQAPDAAVRLPQPRRGLRPLRQRRPALFRSARAFPPASYRR